LTLISIGVKVIKIAPVVKLVDTLDLGSSAARCGGSSPSRRTIKTCLRGTLMKILFAVFAAVVSITAFGMFHTAAAQTQYAEITSVEPAYQTNYVNRPTEQCQIVRVPIYGRTGNGATGLEVLGGALFGGLLGKAVTDEDEGAIVGGLIGGAVAAEAGRGQRVIVGYENKRQCSVVDNWVQQSQITHYDITYDWEGIQSYSRVYEPYVVGELVPVNVQISLIGE
jgi:uncharacterized protein YcfJ